MHSDGTYVGRAAPEIDIFEAQVSTTEGGHVSQSCQWAPYNYAYQWFNTSDNLIIYDDEMTQLNSYMGGVYQQATSAVSLTSELIASNHRALSDRSFRPGVLPARDRLLRGVRFRVCAWLR